jgi:hypothetical protein
VTDSEDATSVSDQEDVAENTTTGPDTDDRTVSDDATTAESDTEDRLAMLQNGLSDIQIFLAVFGGLLAVGFIMIFL